MGPILFLAGAVCLVYVLAVVGGGRTVAASTPLRAHSPVATVVIALLALLLLAGGLAVMAGS